VSRGEITPEVERFIRAHVHSVEQLEVLLLLSGAADRQWSAAQVSQQLQRQVDSVAGRLHSFAEQGLLQASGESPRLYRYSPGDSDRDAIRALEQAYRIRKDAVIQLIFTPASGGAASNSLRAFSDAFRIRKDT
jgi:hypothetical protein